MIKIHLYNSKNPEQEIDFTISDRSAIGINRINYDKLNNTIQHWYLFTGSGSMALINPFSEMIPLSTFKTTYDYALETNIPAARQADETICESLSYLLGVELAEREKIKNRVQLLTLSKNQPEFYRFVKPAIRYVRSIGKQQALDQYLESPSNFMEAVKQHS